MKQFFKQILTGKDNETFDFVRVLAVVGAVEGLALMGYTVVYRGEHFDFTTFGTGLGVLLAAASAALYAKKDTEP